MSDKPKSRKGIGGRKALPDNLKKLRLTTVFLESGKIEAAGGADAAIRKLDNYLKKWPLK